MSAHSMKVERRPRNPGEPARLAYPLEQLRQWRDGSRWDSCGVGLVAHLITDLIEAHERIAELTADRRSAEMRERLRTDMTSYFQDMAGDYFWGPDEVKAKVDFILNVVDEAAAKLSAPAGGES